MRTAANQQVSAASLAFFRIAFGVAMVVNTWLYIPVLVQDYYVDPSLHFPYPPLTFIAPLPGVGMHAVFVAMSIAGLLIAVGLWYRLAVVVFFVLHTYVFLVDSSYFQNHEYLISLLAALLFFLPANRMWSLDARRRPRVAASTVPVWTIWLLRFQVGVPYFFGGIAKLNPDWLAGEPLSMWLAARTDLVVIGPLFTSDPVVTVMNYGSLILDLTIVGFLLSRRTRLPAFLVACVFHLMNAHMFGLFIFPWLMIAATTIFFDPDWPWRVKDRLKRRAETAADRLPGRPHTQGQPIRRSLAVALGIWVAVQVLVPLRHFAIPGDPNWTEEGHRFAWHMKLRDKQVSATFLVTTADGRTVHVDPPDHLGDEQAFQMAGHPSRIVQFAHHLSEMYEGAEVRAETSVSLNGRVPVPLVNPEVDLAAVPLWWWGHAAWILPLNERLR